jgi:integrase
MHAVQHGMYREVVPTSFAAFAPQWLTEYAEIELRDKSYVTVEGMIRVHLVPFFGRYALDQIDEGLARKYMALKRQTREVDDGRLARWRAPEPGEGEQALTAKALAQALGKEVSRIYSYRRRGLPTADGQHDGRDRWARRPSGPGRGGSAPDAWYYLSVAKAWIETHLWKRLKTSDAPLSKKTIRNHMTLLKQMLDHAVAWGHLKYNRLSQMKLPAFDKKEMLFLRPEEVYTLLTGIHEDGEPFIARNWYLPIKVALFTGLRQSEEWGLRIGDLDFERCQITVRQQLIEFSKRRPGETRGRYHLKVTPPKTERGKRNVDVPADLMEELYWYVKGLPDQRADRLVFTNGKGQPTNRKAADGALHRALDRAKVKRIRWHDQRHSYAALQIHANAKPKYLQVQMGHSSVTETMDLYGHLYDDRDPAQANRMYRVVFGGGKRRSGQTRAIALEGGLSDVCSNAVQMRFTDQAVLSGSEPERNQPSNA